jgi:hypothetical protein
MIIIDDNMTVNRVTAQSNTFSSQAQFNSESSLLPPSYGILSLINSYHRENGRSCMKKSVNNRVYLGVPALREWPIVLYKL